MKCKIFGLKSQESTSYGLQIFLQDVQDVSAQLHSKPHVAVHAHCMPLVYSET